VLTYLAPLVVLLNGLAAGVLFNSVLGGFPYLASLPDGRYVHAHAFYGTRYDPAMPICLIGTTLGDLVLAAIAPGTASRSLFLAAAVLAAVVAYVVTRPLLRARERERAGDARRAELDAAKEAKYREIRDAELDHRTGKLSEADWRALDRGLRAEAVAILRRLDELDSPTSDGDGRS
jgi:hypothetical protein